jgi:hypothetical protein
MIRRSFLSALASSPAIAYLFRGPRRATASQPENVQPPAEPPPEPIQPRIGEWVVAERLNTGNIVILGSDGMVRPSTGGDRFTLSVGVAGRPYEVGEIIRPVTSGSYTGLFNWPS